MFLINKRRSADAQYWTLLYQTDKSMCSVREGVLKNFAIFTRKHLCWSLFFIFIKKRLQQRCFAVSKFLRSFILKNIGLGLLLNWTYEVIVLNFVSGQSLSKPSWLGNITKIPLASVTQPGIFRDRAGFLKQGQLDKHFVYDWQKNDPAGKKFNFFSPWYF